MEFRITPHSGPQAPANAIDLLWQQLGADHEEARFVRAGAEIRAVWDADARTSMEPEELEETGRRAVLKIVLDVCERTPELRPEWFAVSRRRP